MSRMEFYTYRIGEVFNRFSSGKSLNEKYITPNGKYPVYGGNGLRGYTETSNFNGECILVGRQGAKCGNVRYFLGEGYMTDHAIVGVANKKFDIKYLSYALSSLNLNRLSGQAAQPGLSVTILKKQKILLPSYENQQNISKIIDYYDLLIENNNKRIKILEQMAEELYKEWFVRFRYPGYEHDSFVGDIPIRWKISRIKELGKIITGKTPSTKNESYYGEYCMFVKTPDMHGNTFVISTSENLSQEGSDSQKNCLIEPDSIMVSCIGTGGIVAINKKLAHTNQQINSIVLKNIDYLYWTYFAVKSLKETIEMYGNTGTTMTNLSKGKFEKIKIVNPNDELKRLFQSKVQPLMDELYNLIESNENLVKQRDLLLPSLMSGKLEVK